MPLDPDLEGFLELAQMGRLSGKSQAMHAVSVEQARAQFEATSQVLDVAPPNSVHATELEFTARDGHRLAARLYRTPGSATGEQPVILYFHGGGYVVGSLDSHDAICRRLAASGTHAVLAPAYRLAPEAPFPAAVHDAVDAANWLSEQAVHWGLDNRRISVAGDSVGATLATVVAITAVREPHELQFKPVAQLLFYPVTDCSTTRPSHARYAEDYLLESETLQWFYQHYCQGTEQRLDWRVSPLLAPDLTALAPALVSLAEYDPLFDEGLEYARYLEATGTRVTLDIQQGLTHDFLRMSGISSGIGAVYQKIDDWLAQVAGY